MFVRNVLPVLFVSVFVAGCSGQGGSILISSQANLSKVQCSKIEGDMVEAYLAVAAQEGVTRKIKKTAKYQAMLRDNKAKLMEIMANRKKEKIDPYVAKYKRLEGRYKTGCGKTAKNLAAHKANYPSKYIR